MSSTIVKLAKWLALACLLLTLLGVLFVRPLVEQALRGVGGTAAVVLQSIGMAASATYETARQQVEASQQVRTLLGEPLIVAPIEDVQWLQATQPQILEFEFPVSGSLGQGVVHVSATSNGQELEISQLTLTTADGMVHELSGD